MQVVAVPLIKLKRSFIISISCFILMFTVYCGIKKVCKDLHSARLTSTFIFIFCRYDVIGFRLNGITRTIFWFLSYLKSRFRNVTDIWKQYFSNLRFYLYTFLRFLFIFLYSSALSSLFYTQQFLGDKHWQSNHFFLCGPTCDRKFSCATLGACCH